MRDLFRSSFLSGAETKDLVLFCQTVARDALSVYASLIFWEGEITHLFT